MKTILILRTDDVLSRILAEYGFKIITLPLIETKVSADLDDFNRKLAEIEKFDGIFLTSQTAARIFAEKLREKNINFGGKVYVLGTRSFEILKTANLNLIFDENANTAREMMTKIAIENLKNKRFLFVRGDKSLRVIPEFLELIAEVDESIVYETAEISVEINKIKELTKKFERNEITAVCFFSPSQAENFIKQFGAKVLYPTKIATIGKTTADFFESRRIRVDFVSPKATAKDFAIELTKYLEKN